MAKKSKKTKKTSKKNVACGAKKNATIEFTKQELEHLRDLMSVFLPTGDNTVSNSLAQSKDFTDAELWKKISEACKSLRIKLGEDAPDFVVTLGAAPVLIVNKV